MIETEQQIAIAAPLDAVWAYARQIERWAELMPGMQSCEVIDEDRSRWVLKVGVGGLVRTVTVNVKVERWAGPGAVDFSYALVGDPVSGSGTYRAVAADGESEVSLRVEVVGSGPLAPMWEAMGRPLLPQLARGFAEQLRHRIEAGSGCVRPASPPVRRGLLARLFRAIVRIFRRQH